MYIQRKWLVKFPLWVALILTSGLTAAAQTPTPTPPSAQVSGGTAAVPAANPADVASMDSTIAALYDVISGPPGKRNWDRFRSLFVPGARLIPTGLRPAIGLVNTRVLTVDDYAHNAGPFFEHE